MADADKTLSLGVRITGEVNKSLDDALARVESVLSKYAKSFLNIDAASGKASSNIKKYTDDLENASKRGALMSGAKEFGISNRQITEYSKSLQQVDSHFNKIASGSGPKASAAQKVINSEYALGNLAMRSYRGEIKLTSEWFQKTASSASSHNEAVKKVSKAHADGTAQANKFSLSIKDIVSSLQTVATYGVASAALYGFINTMRTGVSTIMDYSQALKNLQAISGATDAEVSLMGDAIKKVSDNTQFSLAETSNGMVLLTQAGLTASEATSAMEATANLATGTMSGMVETTDLMTTTMRAFGIEAANSSRIADVMANAVNKSKLNIEQLRIAFGYVGSAAHQAGLTMEETGASMMNMADAGLRASTIGTSFRQILSKLLAPNKAIREEFEAAGVALEKINPTTNSWADVLKNLSGVLKNTEDGTIDMAKAFKFFELRGAQAAAVIVKSFNEGRYQDAIDSLYQTGSASDMAQTQMEGLSYQFMNMVNKAKLLAVSIGESGVGGALFVLIRGVALGLEGLNAFVNTGLGEFIIKAGLTTVAVYGLVTAFKSLGIATPIILALKNAIGLLTGSVLAYGPIMAGASRSMLTFGTIVKTLGGKFFLIAAAIGAVVAGFAMFSNRSEKAAEAAGKLSAEAEGTANDLSTFIKILEDTKDPKEFKAALGSLKDGHKELAKKITLAADAMDIESIAGEKLIKTMKDLEKVQRQESIDQKKKQLPQLKSDVESAKKWDERKKGNSSGLEGGKTVAWMWEKLWGKEAGQNLKDKTNEYNLAIQGLLDNMSIQVEKGEITREEMGKQVEALGLVGEAAKKASIALGLYDEASRRSKKDKDEADRIAAETAEHKKAWMNVYKDLDNLRKADLIAARSALDSKIASLRKNAGDMKLSAEEVSAMVADLETQALNEFMGKQEKKVATYEEETKTLEAEYDKQIAIVGEREEKKYVTHSEATKRKLSIEQKYLNDSLDLAKKNAEKMAEYHGEDSDDYQKAANEIKEVEAKLAEFRIKKVKDVDDAIEKSVKERVDIIDASVNEESALYQKASSQIELDEALGNKNHEQAIQEKQKLELQFLQFRVDKASEAVNAIIAEGGRETEEYKKRINEKLQAEKELIDAKASIAKGSDKGDKKESTTTLDKLIDLEPYIDQYRNFKGTLGELNKEFDRLNDASIKTQAIHDLLWINYQYTESAKALAGIREQYEAVAKAAGEYGLAINLNNDVFKEMSLDDFKADIAGRIEGYADFKRSLSEASGEIDKFTRRTNSWISKSGDVSSDAEYAFTEARKAYSDFIKKTGSMSNAFSKMSIEDAEAMAEGVLEAYDEMASAGQSYIDDLKSEWESLGDEIDGIKDKITGISQSTEDSIRELERNTMDDAAAWDDTVAEFNEKYNKARSLLADGNTDAAVAMFEDAKNIAKSLAKEVQDEYGNTIHTLEESTTTASSLMRRASDAAVEALQAQSRDLKSQQSDLVKDIEKTTGALNAMKAAASGGANLSGGLGGSSGGGIELKSYGDGGMINGNSHASGGVIIEAEGGEGVVSRRGIQSGPTEFFHAYNKGMIPRAILESIVGRLGRFGNGGLIREKISVPKINYPKAARGGIIVPTGGETGSVRDQVNVAIDLGMGRAVKGIFQRNDAAMFVKQLKAAQAGSIG